VEAGTQPELADCSWHGAACWREAGMGFLGAGAVSEHFCVCVSGERVALLCRMFCGGSGSRRGRAGDAEGDERNGRNGSLRSRESGHFDLGGSGDLRSEDYAESALGAVGGGEKIPPSAARRTKSVRKKKPGRSARNGGCVLGRAYVGPEGPTPLRRKADPSAGLGMTDKNQSVRKAVVSRRKRFS